MGAAVHLHQFAHETPSFTPPAMGADAPGTGDQPCLLQPSPEGDTRYFQSGLGQQIRAMRRVATRPVLPIPRQGLLTQFRLPGIARTPA